MTLKERNEKIKDLKSRIVSAKKDADYYNAMQLALKLVINGEYGAMANAHFPMFCAPVANAITSMGREIVQYMEEVNNEYWSKRWHVDYDLHQHLGINTPEPINIEKDPVSIYIDTDSLFVGWEPALKSCNWQGEPLEFILKANEFRISKYFTKKLDEYAEKYGVKNIQDFELEKVMESVIFLEKKRYVQNIVMEDGFKHNRLNYIASKGVELVKSSTPLFVREQVTDLMKYLLDTRHDLSISTLNKKIREIKNLFKMADIEDISSTSSLSNYEKWCINDQSKFEYQSGTPYHVKAAIFANYLLNQNPEYKSKYNLIKSGTKIKMYYTKDSRNNAFAYERGMYPKEYAPPIDYDMQFERTVLKLINMFTKALKLPELNSRLTFSLSLFD